MMNQRTKIIVYIIISIATLTPLMAKNFFKKFINIVPLNPLKSAVLATTKIVNGPNVLIPTNISDVKTILIDNFHVVEEKVFYRSGQLSFDALQGYIEQYGIKTVINLRGEHPEDNWWLQEKEVTSRYGCCFFNIPMRASVLTGKDKIRKILNIFDTAQRPILVHCLSGIDRTGEISALWVLDQQGKTNQEALKQLSLWHLHSSSNYPAKDFLIKIWKGRSWFEQYYNPSDYPQFQVDTVLP